MPTLAPPQSSETADQPAEIWMTQGSQSNGKEASSILKLAQEAFEHWVQRADVLVATSELSGDLSYEHLLPTSHSVVKVRYKMVGRLEPRRYTIDD